jgi:spore maturation protein CgeB
MRVLVVDTYYAAFLDEHYRSRPGRAESSYADQHASLMERCFGTSDAFSLGLRAAGHDATEIVANCLPLQLRWAAEHGAARSARAAARLPGRLGARAHSELLRRIAREQAADFEADVVLCQDMSFFARADLDALRADGRLVVGQIASPPPDEERVRGYDLILTSFPHFVERFRALGVRSEYLRLAFHRAVLDRLPATERSRPLTFVGSVDPRVHGEGAALLERVARELPLEAFGYGAEQLPAGSTLAAAHGGEAWGLDMYRLLAESRVTLNRHIRAAEGYANNMRLYEATGVGAFVITEAAPNLADILEPGVEAVTYTGADELIDKARHYLEHEDERAAIAAAGQVRTLREHTYEQRVRELVALL